jgi:PAS domain S-box-containing protein
MLLTFLAVSYREVETTLVAAGQERAQIAADQIAGMLSESLAVPLNQNVAIAADADLRAFLREPTEETQAAARDALAPHTVQSFHRVEVWDASGSVLLEISRPSSPDSAGTTWEFPRGAPPADEGVSEFRAVGDANYFDITVAVRGDSSPGSPPLGYVRRFGSISTSSGEAIRGLIGSESVVKLGTLGRPVWTDLYSVVDPPPPSVGSTTSGEYRSSDGQRWLGASAAIQGSPWSTWIGFPRSQIVAPARQFMRRMLLLALLFVVIGVVWAAMLGVRLTLPLHALAQAAEKIAAGDYSRRVRTAKGDEIGRVGEAFNKMTDRIEEALGALRESHDQTHFALAAASIGVWNLQVETGQLACSDSMRFVHGLSADELPRTRDDLLALVHPDDRESVRQRLVDPVSGDDVFDLDYKGLRPDGSIHWIEGKARVQVDHSGQALSVLGVSMDVTDRLKLESELRQSQKLEAVGRMAGGIAHDFNNLLNVIKGCAALMYQDLPEGSPIREDTAEIERAADRAASLTHQLLAFSRKQVLQPKVLDANDLVREVAKLLSRTIREDIDLNTHLEPSLRKVEVDPGQIHQVLMNLAVNARDAMPNGGVLTIETLNVDVTAADARAAAASIEPGAYTCLKVSDNGMGMDPATAAQIFDPFFTTKEPGKGTGLGLASVFGIIKQSGGYITVETEQEVGTVFEIYLPSATHEQSVETDGGTRLAGSARGETILVVEDDPALRKLFRRVLDGGGYTVLQAANGEDALRVIGNHDGNIELVISDVIMPVMSGLQMAEQLARSHPRLRILFTSGYAEEEIGRPGLQIPPSAFLQKPIAPHALLTTVREFLDSGPTEYGRHGSVGIAL